MEQFDSFVMFRSFSESLRELPPEVELELRHAIDDYALDGIEPELSGLAKTIWRLMQPNLESNRSKRAAGSKGGAVKQKPSAAKATDKQDASKPEADDKQSGSRMQAKLKQTESKPEADDKQTATYVDVDVDVDGDVDEDTGGPGDPDAPAALDPDPKPKKSAEILSRAQLARFDRWYATYPRKRERGAAMRAWKKINPDDALTDVMIRAVQEQERARQAAGSELKYVKYPARWLNARCWEDECDIELPAAQNRRIQSDNRTDWDIIAAEYERNRADDA